MLSGEKAASPGLMTNEVLRISLPSRSIMRSPVSIVGPGIETEKAR
jgi:hypothetical protein